MHIIHSESIIASHINNTKQQQISLKKVSDIKNELEKLFKENGILIYIDNTRGSLLNTMNISPDLFELDKKHNIIKCKNLKKLEKETEHYFEAKIPGEIKNQYKKFMEEIS